MWINKKEFRNLQAKAREWDNLQDKKIERVDELPIFGKYFVGINSRGFWQFYRIDNLIRGVPKPDIIYCHTTEQAKSIIENLDIGIERIIKVKELNRGLTTSEQT